tara:strand:- start:151 stop:558 length:408 start_codon:yes stop_codon:yes gene_type:complete
MSTLKVDTIQDKNTIHSSTTAQLFSGRVKVWWNYAQRTGPAITNSYNVSSITDSATGQYTVNFSVTLFKPCGSTSSSYNNDAFDSSYSDMTNLYASSTTAQVETFNFGVNAPSTGATSLHDCDFNYGLIYDASEV